MDQRKVEEKNAPSACMEQKEDNSISFICTNCKNALRLLVKVHLENQANEMKKWSNYGMVEKCVDY